MLRRTTEFQSELVVAIGLYSILNFQIEQLPVEPFYDFNFLLPDANQLHIFALSL
ncbi:hypothetical protein [Leptolyngbya sp. FACHB-16]|uniref:hypothetical protein n=1 Tax=unclassified Leptolyngbya TaxID=2650499 RepID=UPI001689C1D7|nr:hypothetical protein [Leptolyngbya sp. FACHB-16]MBD2158837.1 hypothetical protein [Leptolyngbya sp. FACHB-16]